jgi:hypothetical protein
MAQTLTVFISGKYNPKGNMISGKILVYMPGTIQFGTFKIAKTGPLPSGALESTAAPGAAAPRGGGAILHLAGKSNGKAYFIDLAELPTPNKHAIDLYLNSGTQTGDALFDNGEFVEYDGLAYLAAGGAGVLSGVDMLGDRVLIFFAAPKGKARRGNAWIYATTFGLVDIKLSALKQVAAP